MERQFKKLGLDVEFVEAVEGRELTAEKLERLCDINSIKKNPQWLRPGIVACALSHRLCYEKFLQSTEKVALILEDDVILDFEIHQLIPELESSIKDLEVILLYFQSFKRIEISTVGSEDIGGGFQLFYPVNFQALGSSGAYVISRASAKNIHDTMMPIRYSIDNWVDHIQNGSINTIRLSIPFVAQPIHATSAVDYIDHNSFAGRIKEFISETKIFPLYQLIRLRKERTWRRMTSFSFSPQSSPLQPIDRLQSSS